MVRFFKSGNVSYWSLYSLCVVILNPQGANKSSFGGIRAEPFRPLNPTAPSSGVPAHAARPGCSLKPGAPPLPPRSSGFYVTSFTLFIEHLLCSHCARSYCHILFLVLSPPRNLETFTYWKVEVHRSWAICTRLHSERAPGCKSKSRLVTLALFFSAISYSSASFAGKICSVTEAASKQSC